MVARCPFLYPSRLRRSLAHSRETPLTRPNRRACSQAMPSLPNPTTCKGWPHHRGLRPLLFSNSDVGSFTSHKNKSMKVLWHGTYGFSSLSKKTRKSNHLQMSLQRQHFLLSYLTTLSVGLAEVWTRDLPVWNFCCWVADIPPSLRNFPQRQWARRNAQCMFSQASGELNC